MPNENSPEYVKALYELASVALTKQDTVYAIRLLEKLVSIHDPFYTPFALSLLDNAYRTIGREDLEIKTQNLIIDLPRPQQELLNPTYVAGCFTKRCDYKTAGTIYLENLAIAPGSPNLNAGYAEVCLLGGDLGSALNSIKLLINEPDIQWQILGRMFMGFVLTLKNKNDEAVKEFTWVGHFLKSSGLPAPGWDYRDEQPILSKLGPNARMAEILLMALNRRMTLQEFVQTWEALTVAASPAPLV
jgi:tetratricopeptide (TPR) repeat protein